MGKRQEYELVFSDLKSAQNEQEVIENITKIVKGFTSDFYKNDLFENSYFKSLLFDIRDEITQELKDIKSTLNEEIEGIDNKLSKLNQSGITSILNPEVSKLRNLKKECIILIKELDNRLVDLKNL